MSQEENQDRQRKKFQPPSRKSLDDFLKDIGNQVYQTGDKDLQQFFDESKATLTATNKELEELKKWEDPHAIDAEHDKVVNKTRIFLQSKPMPDLTASEKSTLDKLAQIIAVKDQTLEHFMVTGADSANEIVEMMRHTFDDFVKKSTKAEEVLSLERDLKSGEKRDQTTIPLGEEKDIWVGETYSGILSKLVEEKKKKNESQRANMNLVNGLGAGNETNGQEGPGVEGQPEGGGQPGGEGK